MFIFSGRELTDFFFLNFSLLRFRYSERQMCGVVNGNNDTEATAGTMNDGNLVFISLLDIDNFVYSFLWQLN